MTFIDSLHKHKLKNKATSKIKTQEVLSSLSLNGVGIYLRDGSFEFDIGIVNLHPTKVTHWVLFFHECYFDSFGITEPKNFLILFQNDTDIVYFQNTRYRDLQKKEIPNVQLIVYIQFTW